MKRQITSDKPSWRHGFLTAALGSLFLLEPASVRAANLIVNGDFEYRSDLTTNLWVPLYTNVVGNGLVMCVSDAVVLPQRFYRVVDATNQMPR